ncbi:MAG: 7-cyano-7-deazaguanine synthase QueC [Deltaproteobacteria bacterium]|nr:7-cyano-7-deazaguanine synthase QueC [Deltaproteobacteria bacterium]
MVKSVVLLSGGLDSAVAATIAVSKGECAFLHINYGQRTEAKELDSFNRIAEHFKIQKRLVTDISYLKQVGGSALTDERIDVPPADLDNKEIPITYVPFRNAHLLSIAISWAEVLGAKEVYIGAVEEDSSGYPDCRAEFFKAFEKAASLGTRPETQIKIITPLINMRKSEIVKEGIRLSAPLQFTWSCYKDSSEACGECDSCLLRLRGFKEAEAIDPIPYKAKPL